MGLTNRTADRLDEVSVGFIPEDSWKGATAPEHPIPLNPPLEDSVPGSKPWVAAGDGPAVSIVVAAHLRPDYIVGAVQSVLRSGLPTNQLDIVVTKGYRSDEQDKVLADLGARVFLDFDVGVGLQLWRAIPLARAPLVAFLDDDDQFETTRLKHVRQIFLDHPEIGFYRNRVKLIDLDGELVPMDLYDPEELDALLDHTGPLDRLSVRDPNSFDTLRKCRPWFNTSSMVVRRELLTGPFGRLLATAHHAPDVRLYLIALLSGTGIYLDDQRLTRYRTSLPTWSAQATRAAVDWDSVRVTAQLAQKFAPDPWPAQFWTLVSAAEKRALWSDFLSQLENRRPRNKVISALNRYLKFLVRSPREIYLEPSRAFYLACLATYLIDPSWGNAVLKKAAASTTINRSKRRTGRYDSAGVK